MSTLRYPVTVIVEFADEAQLAEWAEYIGCGPRAAVMRKELRHFIREVAQLAFDRAGGAEGAQVSLPVRAVRDMEAKEG